MSIETLLIGVLAIIIGMAFLFEGFPFFLLLLPIWAFFAGLVGGAGAVTALFGDGFLSTVLGWAVGVGLGLVFAVLSYLFYWVAVILVGASIGYAIGTGAMAALGVDFNLVVVAAGLVVGAVLAVVTIVLGVPKYLIVVLTALGGATAILSGVFLIFGLVDLDGFRFGVAGATWLVIKDDVVWVLAWAVLFAVGVISQVRTAIPAIEREAYRYS
jgi:hypothetical protein